MSHDPAERRSAPRAEGAFPILVGPDGREGRVKNISESGVACEVPDPVAEMTMVGLSFQLPGEEHPHQVTGAIVWCAPKGAGRGYELGIFFQDIEDNTRSALRRYVTEVIRA